MYLPSYPVLCLSPNATLVTPSLVVDIIHQVCGGRRAASCPSDGPCLHVVDGGGAHHRPIRGCGEQSRAPNGVQTAIQMEGRRRVPTRPAFLVCSCIDLSTFPRARARMLRGPARLTK